MEQIFVDLHLRIHLDSISGEISFENLYYLSKKRKMQCKKLGKNSRYYISQKYLSQKDLSYRISQIANICLCLNSKPLRSF